MRAGSTVSAKISAISTTMSPFPTSFNNDGWLYGLSFFSLLWLAMLNSVIFGWMVRDIYRCRFRDHPTSLAFLLRLIFAIIPMVGLVRLVPQLLYMALYGEVTGETMATLLHIVRVGDNLALPLGGSWMLLLAMIYYHLFLQLSSPDARRTHVFAPASVWPRLGRAALITILVGFIACLMAVAKGQMGAHAG
jgi:hypothetical protein